MTTGSASKVNTSLLFMVSAFLLAGFFAVRNVSSWPARISYPGDESYEGVALAEMIHLRQGIPIYAAGAKDGFDAATYGPLYYLTGEILVDPANPSYVPLRIVSALAILGCAACCGLLAFRFTGSLFAAWLSPLLFLSYGMATAHGIQGLSDGMSLFLYFWGFLVAYRFRNSRGILLAVPIMILGFYYKPQYVAGLLAVPTFLFLDKRRRLALEFISLLGVGGLGTFALFQWVIFRGQAFWQHFLFYQTALLSWHLLGRALFVFAILLFLMVVLSVEYLREAPNKLVSCYLFFAVLLGVLTFCKEAGGVHYFFETVFLVCALVPALLASRVAARIYPLDLILLLSIALLAAQWLTKLPPQRSDVEKYDTMQSFLRGHFAPHAASLSLAPGDLLQAALETPYSGLFQLAQLDHGGLVHDRELVSKIREKRFAVIVLNFDAARERDPYWLRFYTPAILEAVGDRYKLEATLEMPSPTKDRSQDSFYIYVPREPVTAAQKPAGQLKNPQPVPANSAHARTRPSTKRM